MSGPGEDELACLQSELAEAEAAIATLIRENASLAHRAARPGHSLPKTGAPPPGEPPADLSRPAPSQVYRSLDRSVQAEEALAQAHATIASLRIEKAILLSQSAARTRKWYAVRPGFFAFTAILGLVVFLWFAAGSHDIFVLVAILLAIGGTVFYLIGAIPPRDGPREGPPPIPPTFPGV